MSEDLAAELQWVVQRVARLQKDHATLHVALKSWQDEAQKRNDKACTATERANRAEGERDRFKIELDRTVAQRESTREANNALMERNVELQAGVQKLTKEADELRATWRAANASLEDQGGHLFNAQQASDSWRKACNRSDEELLRVRAETQKQEVEALKAIESLRTDLQGAIDKCRALEENKDWQDIAALDLLKILVRHFPNQSLLIAQTWLPRIYGPKQHPDPNTWCQEVFTQFLVEPEHDLDPGQICRWKYVDTDVLLTEQSKTAVAQKRVEQLKEELDRVKRIMQVAAEQVYQFQSNQR